ncbi:MAG: dephospho-CoA kinase [Gammaproteobacteria bacterium]|nr:dephospho-CoA kinase [Gammaproteobacteria bacterium]
MFKVGLTGGIASGKSTVSHLFSELGITIIDADNIARDLVEINQPCYDQIVARFGTGILLANQQLDRQKLRHLIFHDENAKEDLEALLHPSIRQQLLVQSESARSSYCILSIPLLIEAKMTDLVDRTLVVDTSAQIQLSRLCARDNITADQALRMITSQVNQQQRLLYADDIIINNDSPDALKQQVIMLHKTYINLANFMTSSCQHPDSHGQ